MGLEVEAKIRWSGFQINWSMTSDRRTDWLSNMNLRVTSLSLQARRMDGNEFLVYKFPLTSMGYRLEGQARHMDGN